MCGSWPTVEALRLVLPPSLLHPMSLGSLPSGTYGNGGGGGLPTNASAYGPAEDDEPGGIDGIAALLDVDENGPQFPPLMATKQRKVTTS